MAEFSNYAELKEAVADWLARSDLGHRIPSFIRLAELKVQRDLRLRFHDETTTGTMTAAQEYIDQPADYIEGRHLRVDTDPIRHVRVVSMSDLADIQQANATGGIPIAMADHKLRIYLAPIPESAHPYTLFYRAGITALSEDNATNWLTTHAPDLLLWGALVAASTYLKDAEGMQMFGTLYNDAHSDVKRQEWRARTGDGPLRVRPQTFA